jgi:[acyl-carrier-protein] S-malonyltransferase
MQEAVPVGVGAMAAVLGAKLDDIESVCAKASEGEICSPANINAPNQVVIAGHATAVDRAIEGMKEIGAKRVVKLNVSAPFHCALMRPAQDRLAMDLKQLRLNDLQVPVVTNVDARITKDAAEVHDALIRQVSAPVRWLQSMTLLIEQGVGTFVEVGPGKILSGLMRQINREIDCFNVEDAASLQATQAKLQSNT